MAGFLAIPCMQDSHSSLLCMTSSRVRSVFPGIVSALGAAALLSLMPAAVAQGVPGVNSVTHEMLQAQAEYSQAPAPEYTLSPSQLPSRVTDVSGALTPEQNAELDAAIHQFLVDHHKSIFIAYMPSFGEYAPMEWTEQAAAANGGGNTLVLAVATEDRQYALSADTSAGYWTDQELDDVEDAIFPSLVDSDWAGVGFAAVEDVVASAWVDEEPAILMGEEEQTPDFLSPSVDALDSAEGDRAAQKAEETNVWATVGFLSLLVAIGGGVGAIWRRHHKKKAREQLAIARRLSPDDVTALTHLSTSTLEDRTEEVIAVTEESVRRARAELSVATAEFGPNRTRPLTRALGDAERVLQQAHQTQQELNIAIMEFGADHHQLVIRVLTDAVREVQRLSQARSNLRSSTPDSAPRRRITLVKLIFSCEVVHEKLDEQTDRFAELRNLVSHAAPKLDEMTQRAVSLRTRIKKARIILSDLQARRSPETVTSIVDNVDMAFGSLEHVERQLSAGRELNAKPAGQQGRLVSVVQDIEDSLNEADGLLLRVEHAEEEIAAAEEGIQPLIDEVTETLRKTNTLKERSESKGITTASAYVEEIMSETPSILDEVRLQAISDPLRAYSTLIESATQLDKHYDDLLAFTIVQERQLKLLHDNLSTARSHIHAAENLITDHGEIVKLRARTGLADAHRMLEYATTTHSLPLWQATEYAHQAAQQAQEASRWAQEDVKNYQEEMKRKLEEAEEMKNRRTRNSTSFWSSFSSYSSPSPSPRTSPSPRPRPKPRPSSGFSSRGGSF